MNSKPTHGVFMNIRDRFTNEQVDGVVIADDADWDPEVAWCPRCGAKPGQECSSETGTELGVYIHMERQSAQAHEPQEEV